MTIPPDLVARLAQAPGPDLSPAELHAVYGEEFLRLETLFVAELDSGLRGLLDALGSGDAAQMRELAYRLVGLLGSFGAHEATQRALAVVDAPDESLSAAALALAAGLGKVRGRFPTLAVM